MTADVRTAAQRDCLTCGKPYSPTDDNQKYCEHICKRQNYAMRRYGFEYAVQWRWDQEAKRTRGGSQSGHRSIREFNGDDVWRDEDGMIWQRISDTEKAIKATIGLTIARVTPTRRQIGEVLAGGKEQFRSYPNNDDDRERFMQEADKVLALMQGLAEGGRGD